MHNASNAQKVSGSTDDFSCSSWVTPVKRRTRWADQWSDSDCEDQLVEPSAATHLRDDSYQEPPLRSVEDSNSGLLSKLGTATDLRHEPTDFSFLCQEVLGRDTAGQPQGVTPSLSGQLNSFAAEFVPTLSYQCPIFGVCVLKDEVMSSSDTPSTSALGGAEEPSLPATPVEPSSARAENTLRSLTATQRRAPRVAPDHRQSQLLNLQDVLTPNKENAGGQDILTPNKPVAEKKRAGGGTRKRKPTGADSENPKRTKSEEREAPPRAARAVDAPPTPTLAPTPGGGYPVWSQEKPDVSEDDWVRRIELRRKALLIGKETREYQWYAERRNSADFLDSGLIVPGTPDPDDRSVSKRRWKYDVQQWRLAVKQRFLDSDEGQGSWTGMDPPLLDPGSADASPSARSMTL